MTDSRATHDSHLPLGDGPPATHGDSPSSAAADGVSRPAEQSRPQPFRDTHDVDPQPGDALRPAGDLQAGWSPRTVDAAESRVILARQALEQHLSAARGRLRRAGAARGLLLGALGGLLVLGLLAALVVQGVVSPPSRLTLLAGGLLVAAASALRGGWRTPAPREVARLIEQQWPDLNSGLLAALDQRPSHPDGRYGFLQGEVIAQAARHATLHDWRDIQSLKTLRWLQVSALAVLGGLAWGAWSLPSQPAANNVANLSPDALATPTATGTLTVEPGSVEVERGSSVLIMARLTGPLPDAATVEFLTPASASPGSSAPASGSGTIAANASPDSSSGQSAETGAAMPVAPLTMSRSLDDPLFAVRLPEVVAPLSYRVRAGRLVSETFTLAVFEYPRLERLDARLVYPEYTGLSPRDLADVRTLSAVEGTTIELLCRLNKPVAKAQWTTEGEPPVELRPDAADPTMWRGELRAVTSRRLSLVLRDAEGRANTQPAELTVQVVPNQPAVVKALFPTRDVDVSPLEELDVQAQVYDDFGVPRAGLTFSLAGQPPVEVPLASDLAGQSRQQVASTIACETLNAQPDQLLAWYFWADDIGPDGQPRRAMGEMYFAEVRRFEEVFRQADPASAAQQRQQPSPAGEPGRENPEGPAGEVAELQKQIVSATWNIIRRETGSATSEKFAADVEEVAKAQREVFDKANVLSEQTQEAELKQAVAQARTAMQQAAEQLARAAETRAREPLTEALVNARAAWEALLKLRAREQRVARQNRSQGQSSAQANRSPRQQGQLDQLDLEEPDERYQQPQLAQNQPDAAEAQQDRQVLNRLRELARRQHDLNQQVRDLQAALEAETSAARQEEVRRQLKRLQEEQQQLLRDVDDLQGELARPENQERLAGERQQLDEVRQQVQRATESLQKQQAGPAAAAGARAEQRLEELRDRFREQGSESVREGLERLAEEARELQRRQTALDQRLEEAISPSAPNRSLRQSTGRSEIARDLTQQRERLGSLLEEMQQSVSELEASEPLVSRKLYEAAREVQNKNLPRALDAARQSVERGLLEDARDLDAQTSRSLSEFRKAVEEATESVLGGESDALRRARDELRQLSRAVDSELRREDPAGTRAEGDSPAGRPGDREPNTGDEDSRDLADTAGPGSEPRGATPSARPGNSSTARGSRPGAPTGDDPDAEPNAEPGSEPGATPGENPSAGESNRGPTPNRPGTTPGTTAGGNRPGAERGQTPSGEPNASESEPNAAPSGNRQPPGARPAGPARPGEAPPAGERSEATEPGQGQPGQGQPGGPSRRGAARGAPTRGGATGAGNSTLAEQAANEALAPRGPGTAGEEDALNDLAAPFNGGDFRRFTERLRDVEELIDDPRLRAEAARIRERARALKAESQRHSTTPRWDLIRGEIARPLAELSQQVSEELLRRTSRESVVPLDRNPPPPGYSEKVRRYYERLGRGE